MSRPICQATRNDGRPCRAAALPGSASCWCHDPARAQMAAEARSRGAAKANRLRAMRGRRLKLDSAAGLVGFVSGVVQDTLAGKVTLDVARAVLYGCSIQRQLIETGDLERRVADLERRQELERGGPWRA